MSHLYIPLTNCFNNFWFISFKRGKPILSISYRFHDVYYRVNGSFPKINEFLFWVYFVVFCLFSSQFILKIFFLSFSQFSWLVCCLSCVCFLCKTFFLFIYFLALEKNYHNFQVDETWVCTVYCLF